MAFNREKALTAAAKFVAKGQHDRAAKEYVALIEADPSDTRSWLLLAEALTNAGDKPGAIERYLHVAEGYATGNEAQKAIAVYRKVLGLDPNRLDIQTRIAGLYKDLGRTGDAVAAYEFVAQAYFQAGQIAEGLEGFRMVAELEPAAVGKRLRLAELYSREGMVAQAVEHFRLAADRLLADRRTDDYIRVAERLIYHKEDDLPVLRSLAQIYLKQGENRRALVKLNALLRAAPADAEGLELLGETFVAIGKVDKAISVVMELAREQRKGGRKNKETAARVLRKALAWNPENADDIRKIAGEIEAEIAALPPETEPKEPGEGRDAGMDLDVDVVEEEGAGDVDVDVDVDVEEEEERKVEEVPSRPFAPVGANVAPSVVEDGEEGVGDVEKILLEARVYVKYKMFEHALGHLDSVFVRDANHIPALDLQAQILSELGRNAEAADSLVRLAQLVSARDPKLARTHLEQAQKLIPEHTKAEMVLAALDSGDTGPSGETAPLLRGLQGDLHGDPASKPAEPDAVEPAAHVSDAHPATDASEDEPDRSDEPEADPKPVDAAPETDAKPTDTTAASEPASADRPAEPTTSAEPTPAAGVEPSTPSGEVAGEPAQPSERTPLPTSPLPTRFSEKTPLPTRFSEKTPLPTFKPPAGDADERTPTTLKTPQAADETTAPTTAPEQAESGADKPAAPRARASTAKPIRKPPVPATPAKPTTPSPEVEELDSAVIIEELDVDEVAEIVETPAAPPPPRKGPPSRPSKPPAKQPPTLKARPPARPEDSKTLPVPEDSKTLPVPEDSKTLPVPEDSKTLPVPEDSKTLPVPEDSKTLPVPEDSKAAAAPDGGEQGGSEDSRAVAALEDGRAVGQPIVRDIQPSADDSAATPAKPADGPAASSEPSPAARPATTDEAQPAATQPATATDAPTETPAAAAEASDKPATADAPAASGSAAADAATTPDKPTDAATTSDKPATDAPASAKPSAADAATTPDKPTTSASAKPTATGAATTSGKPTAGTPTTAAKPAADKPAAAGTPTPAIRPIRPIRPIKPIRLAKPGQPADAPPVADKAGQPDAAPVAADQAAAPAAADKAAQHDAAPAAADQAAQPDAPADVAAATRPAQPDTAAATDQAAQPDAPADTTPITAVDQAAQPDAPADVAPVAAPAERDDAPAKPEDPRPGDTAALAIDAVLAAELEAEPKPTSFPNIDDEVDELRFFIKSHFEDDAQFAYLDLQRRYPGHPALAEFAGRFTTTIESAAAPVMLDDPRSPSAAMRAAAKPPQSLFEDEDEDDFLASIFDAPASKTPEETAKPRRAVATLDDGADAQTFFDLGTAYREMGLDDDALGQFELAAKDPRWTARARIMMASLRVVRGEHEQAISDLNTAIERATDQDQRSEAGYELGVLYQTLGDKARAVEALSSVAAGYRDRDQRLKTLAR